MVSSILTNNGAMTALQSLKATQKSLLQTQNRISTGLKVATAKDNAATWAVATSMRSDISNYKQVAENLSVSSSIIGTASAAAESIADLVKQVRTKVTSAQNPAVDKGQVQADIDGLLAQIGTIADAASLKGVNLVNSNNSTRVLTSVNQVDGVSTAAYAEIASQNLKIEEGSQLESLVNLTVLSRADQTFSELNDGVTKTTLTVGAGGLDLKSGNTLSFKYVDETDTNRTLVVKMTKDLSTVADLVSYLNADSGFKDKFSADAVFTSGTTASTTAFSISAKNRDSVERLGSLTSDVLSTSNLLTVAAGTGTLAASAFGTTDATVDGGIRRLDVTFADKPLQLGDEFAVKIQTSAANEDKIFTFKLKVMSDDYATGDVVYDGSSENDRVYVIAVAESDVTNPNVTGKDIALKFQTALATGSTNWNAASTNVTGQYFNSGAGSATAGTDFEVAVDSTTGTLSVLSADGTTDDLLGFNSSKTDYQTLLNKLDAATVAIGNAGAAFGTAGTRIDLQKEFIEKLVDTLTTGMGALVDADMSEEAARLQALQVQEQLGTQALSIANQAPQSILSLFR
jgi:flagellin